MSKMGRWVFDQQMKEIEDLNKHRQVKDCVYDNHSTVDENRFSLCHLGEKVLELHSKYPNDQELGKKIREEVINLLGKND